MNNETDGCKNISNEPLNQIAYITDLYGHIKKLMNNILTQVNQNNNLNTQVQGEYILRNLDDAYHYIKF